MENKPTRIIWHHTAVKGNKHQSTGVNNVHKARGFPKSLLGFYGGYHILIEKDGTIFRYRKDNEVGAHAKGHNLNTLGISMAGHFNVETPAQEQTNSFIVTIANWMLDYHIPATRVRPHRAVGKTACPGTTLNDDWARPAMVGSNEHPSARDIKKVLYHLLKRENAAQR